jgi:hypothetical protein
MGLNAILLLFIGSFCVSTSWDGWEFKYWGGKFWKLDGGCCVWVQWDGKF